MSKTHRFSVEVGATTTRKGRAPHMVTRAHSAKKGTYNRAAIKRELSKTIDAAYDDNAAELDEFQRLMEHLEDEYEGWI